MKTRESKFLVFIALFAFFSRIAFQIFYSGDASYAGFFEAPWEDSDGAVYEKLGYAMATSGNSRINDHPIVAQLHPLYPYFLASIYKLFGHHYFLIRVIQALISSFTVVLIFFIAKKTFNRNVGYVSSIFGALSPMSIYACSRFMAETLFSFLLCFFIYFLLRMEKGKAIGEALAAGIFISLSLFTNSMIFGFIPFIVIWFVTICKEKNILLRNIIIVFATIGLALTLKGFLIKDPITHEDVVYRALWLWNNPYKENNEKYISPTHPEFKEFMETLEGEHLLPDGYRRNEGEKNSTNAKVIFPDHKVLFFDYIKDSPLEYIKGAGYRFLLFWHFDSKSVRTDVKTKYGLIGFLSYGIFIPFLLLGLCLSLTNWKKSLLFYFLFIYFSLVAALLSSGIRKRIPIEPFIHMYIAYGLTWLWDKFYKMKGHLND